MNEFEGSDQDAVEISESPNLAPIEIDGEAIKGREAEAQADLQESEHNSLFIERDSDELLVLFSGNNGHFKLLNKFRNFSGNILALRDQTNKWYQNEPHPLPVLAPMVGEFVSGRGFKKSIVVGDSAGAYAALYATPFIPSAVCLALSPQTFQVTDKLNVRLTDGRRISRSSGSIINLRPHLKKNISGTKFLVTGISETQNVPPSYLWADHFQAANLVGVPNVEILLCPQQHHPIIWYLNPVPVLEFLFGNHELCLSSPSEAAIELAKVIQFYRPA